MAGLVVRTVGAGAGDDTIGTVVAGPRSTLLIKLVVVSRPDVPEIGQNSRRGRDRIRCVSTQHESFCLGHGTTG